MPLRRLTGHEKRVVAARDGWTCGMCHEMLDATYEVDHIIPLHRGGADHVDNCWALHTECHKKKTQREEIERVRADQTRRVAGASPSLECTRCGLRVSPYFLHRCCVGQPPTEK